jgi:hypothetical protein
MEFTDNREPGLVQYNVPGWEVVRMLDNNANSGVLPIAARVRYDGANRGEWIDRYDMYKHPLAFFVSFYYDILWEGDGDKRIELQESEDG